MSRDLSTPHAPLLCVCSLGTTAGLLLVARSSSARWTKKGRENHEEENKKEQLITVCDSISIVHFKESFKRIVSFANITSLDVDGKPREQLVDLPVTVGFSSFQSGFNSLQLMFVDRMTPYPVLLESSGA